jgi:acid phosphatase
MSEDEESTREVKAGESRSLLSTSTRTVVLASFILSVSRNSLSDISRRLVTEAQVVLIAMVCWLALSLTALASVSSAQWVKGKAFDRIAVIWLENTDYDLAAGDPNLAWLAKKGISLTNYYAVTHPSMPNYAAAISGDYYGINHDDMVAIPSNVSTLVDLLEDKGISWGEYQEDMPSVGFQGMSYKNPKTGANMYVRKHNPAVLYDSNAKKSDRLAKMKPLTQFNTDLNSGSLPQWMFITPNMTSDGQ